MCRFTDDTVLTVALAESILHGTPYVDLLKAYYRGLPRAGYGGTFHQWAQSEEYGPYNSWGNGSAMRVSPVGFAFDTIEDVLDRAKGSAEVTHDHPEGIKGAQSVASAIFLARTGQGKDEIKNYVETTFGYRLDRTLDEIRPTYEFDAVSCPAGRSRRRSRRSSSRTASRTRSARPSRSAATATRSPASREGSPRRIMEGSPSRSASASSRSWTTGWGT